MIKQFATGVVLALIVLASGCAGDLDTVEPEWTWSYDPSCSDPTDEQQVMVAKGIALWDAWNVSLTYAPEGMADVPHVELCFTASEPREGYSGWTSDRSTGDASIEIFRDVSPQHRLASVVAHEFGHLVIGNQSFHFGAIDGFGIAANTLSNLSRRWTDEDIDHLSSFGLQYQNDHQ
jgi:hypothetical protein